MQVDGIDGMTLEELNAQFEAGARFVVFRYCVSALLATVSHESGITFIPAGESAVRRGLGYTITSLLLGWWGIPEGPVGTIHALVTNLSGGRDVTSRVMRSLYYDKETRCYRLPDDFRTDG